ncbi:hypothetical protein [Amycolatopsis sp. NPDC054798]
MPTEITFHEDGEIGMALQAMGGERAMDVDGEPLANVLGRIATDMVAGRRTAAEGVEAYKELRDRLPDGSAARQCLNFAINRIDAPPSPVPEVPGGTPAGPLRTLMEDLHSIPLVRRDGRETQALQELLARTYGDKPGRRASLGRLTMELRRFNGLRHESQGDAGKFDIDRAVSRAIDELKNSDQPRDRS